MLTNNIWQTMGVRKMNKLYTLFEASLLLHVSESTLYRWIHHKKIEYVKLGSRVMFSEKSLQEFIKNNTIVPE